MVKNVSSFPFLFSSLWFTWKKRTQVFISETFLTFGNLLFIMKKEQVSSSQSLARNAIIFLRSSKKQVWRWGLNKCGLFIWQVQGHRWRIMIQEWRWKAANAECVITPQKRHLTWKLWETVQIWLRILWDKWGGHWGINTLTTIIYWLGAVHRGTRFPRHLQPTVLISTVDYSRLRAALAKMRQVHHWKSGGWIQKGWQGPQETDRTGVSICSNCAAEISYTILCARHWLLQLPSISCSWHASTYIFVSL